MPFDHAAWFQSLDAAAAKLGGYVDQANLPDGLTPASAGLLWLPERGAPAFQFDDGKLRDVVQQVNTLLDATEDPYGVTDWWLLGHSYLPKGQCPADLLGKDHELLLDLARNVGED